MVQEIIGSATHWWCAERHDNGINHNLRIILPFIFQTLDALYISTRSFPKVLVTLRPAGILQGGTNNFVINLPLLPEIYVNFRAALSLAGDLYCLLGRLSGTKLMELTDRISQLQKEALRFREVRNFFTHLDERLADLSKHGITGATKTNCGIKYSDSARDCFHLVLAGNTIHFTDNKQPLEVGVGRDTFTPIFDAARLVYGEITSHKLHSAAYPPPQDIYP